mgnify:CR=1 FL=1
MEMKIRRLRVEVNGGDENGNGGLMNGSRLGKSKGSQGRSVEKFRTEYSIGKA